MFRNRSNNNKNNSSNNGNGTESDRNIMKAREDDNCSK